VVLIAAFFVAESRRENPLIPLKLLAIRNVQIANWVGVISGLSMFLLFFAVVYYTQLPKEFGGLGLGVISSGLVVAPATVLMLVAGPLLGRMVSKAGPKPVIILGALIGIAGMLLFVYNRGTSTDVTIDAAVSLVGAVSVIIPIVNMVTISLPPESVATGLGLNTMLRNIGGAVGPVVATTILSTYTLNVPKGLAPPGVTLPSATAFDYIFYLGAATLVVGILLALAAKNYVFSKPETKPSG
jgi:MFS family permease